MAVRYVEIGQYPDVRREVRGKLSEILVTTANPGTYAAPEDVTGCFLEMGDDGKWDGASVGTMSKATADALYASGALANLATGVTYREPINGTQYTYDGEEVGWSLMDLIVGPFANITEANAWAAANPSSLFQGLLATIGGALYSWSGSAWAAVGGGSSSPASPTAIGGVYSKTAPVAVSTLAKILATTPAVGTVGLPSDSVGSQMEYGALGWDGHFGTIQGGFPAVLALPTGHVALGASIKCARAGWRRFSWAGSGWTLGNVGSTQLVAQGPPLALAQSVNQSGTEAVAGKTYSQEVTLFQPWDAVRVMYFNRSSNSVVKINKAMALTSDSLSGFNGTSMAKVPITFSGKAAVSVSQSTQYDNNASALPGILVSDLAVLPTYNGVLNQIIGMRTYFDPTSGNNNQTIQDVSATPEPTLGGIAYNNAAGDKLTSFTAMSQAANYYSCSMCAPIGYSFANSVHVSAAIFGDSIAVGQTTTNNWRSIVTVALRNLGIQHAQFGTSGQTSAGTLAVMAHYLSAMAAVDALPTHAIIWAYSPNDSGSDGSTSSTSWAIFQQKLALLKKYGVTPICIGPVPFGAKATLKPMGDLLVSDYGGYNPFMDNSVDGVNWIAANTGDNVHPNDTGVAASITAGFQTWLASKLV